MHTRVHRAGDDTLYLVGGSNDVISLYTAEGFASAVSVSDWRARLEARSDLFGRLGIPWRMLLAPEKLSVLGMDVATALAGEPAVPPAQRFLTALPHPGLVDPTSYLRDQRDAGYRMYPATDSHWTSLGAFSAFQWLMGSFGIAPDYGVFGACGAQTLHYHGDLWEPQFADLGVDAFERRHIPSSITCLEANALVQFKERSGRENDGRLHTGSAASWHNSQAQFDQKVVLFGSSFSDYRAACSLLTFVAALFFREVHFVWSTSVDPGLVERLRPDLVIIEMPERFLPLCPADDLDLESYAEARVQAVLV